jgi:DNA gyrase inhibitor GyrI
MNVLDIAILKDIRFSTAIEALHELSSEHFKVILYLGDEKDIPKTITRIFTDWDKCSDVLETTPPYWMKLSFFSKPHLTWLRLLPPEHIK